MSSSERRYLDAEHNYIQAAKHPKMKKMCTLEAFAISARCPNRPKPVISVQPVAPCLARQAAAAALLCCMLAQAPMTQRPLALPLMAAAISTPVPRALVSTRACPCCSPPFRSSFSGCPCPVTLNPVQHARPLPCNEARAGSKHQACLTMVEH